MKWFGALAELANDQLKSWLRFEESDQLWFNKPKKQRYESYQDGPGTGNNP